MKIGLVGWAARTGIGHINRDLWDHGLVQSWLAPRHPICQHDPAVLPAGAIPCERAGATPIYNHFLDDVDVVLFVEGPQLDHSYDLTNEARKRGKLVVCVPMMEWLPEAPWVADVDLMWAPTQWSTQELLAVASSARRHGVECRWEQGGIAGGWWGIDLARFPFQERDVCKRFLFLNGNGGVLLRKGAQALADAAKLCPDVPILCRSQKKDLPKFSPNVTVFSDNAPERWGIYEKGDVLVAPSRWEGLGLQLYEAQACGLPVLTTDGEPMNECRPLAKIPVARRIWVSLAGRKITTHECDPQGFADLMTSMLGKSYSIASRAARRNVEEHHDVKQLVAAMRSKIAARAEELRSTGKLSAA